MASQLQLPAVRMQFDDDFVGLSGKSKQVFIVRHAESQYNEYTRSWPVLLTCRCCCDPMIIDPQLSQKGYSQAHDIGQELCVTDFLKQHAIELIVVSPLRRALRTALLLFPPDTHKVPFQVCPIHREIGDTSSDVGSQPKDLQLQFPEFQFDDLQENWWQTDNNPGIHQESSASVSRRVQEFAAGLLRRPEQRIVVVGHSAFFARWTQRPKLANCEFFEFQLSTADGGNAAVAQT